LQRQGLTFFFIDINKFVQEENLDAMSFVLSEEPSINKYDFMGKRIVFNNAGRDLSSMDALL
jgi:hypothetical protein